MSQVDDGTRVLERSYAVSDILLQAASSGAAEYKRWVERKCAADVRAAAGTCGLRLMGEPVGCWETYNIGVEESEQPVDTLHVYRLRWTAVPA